MQTIFTQRVPLEGSFSLWMPKGAKPLEVVMKAGEPFLVYWSNTDADVTAESQRDFALRRTGTPMDDLRPDQYVGAFVVNDGHTVFYLFDVTSKPEMPNYTDRLGPIVTETYGPIDREGMAT